jgi:hypothetical protein
VLDRLTRAVEKTPKAEGTINVTQQVRARVHCLCVYGVCCICGVDVRVLQVCGIQSTNLAAQECYALGYSVFDCLRAGGVFFFADSPSALHYTPHS